MAKLFARLPVQDQKHLNLIQSNPLVLQTKSLWDSDAGGILLHMMAVAIERDIKQIGIQDDSVTTTMTRCAADGVERTKSEITVVLWECPFLHFDLLEPAQKEVS